MLIGHSHGGSVIAYCLQRHPEFLPRIAGAAFLATPFVDFRARPGWEREALSLGVGLAIVIWIALSLALLYGSIYLHDLGWKQSPWYALAAVIAGSFGIFPAGKQIATRPTTGLRERLDRLSQRMVTAHLPHGPRYLFMRSPGDEAAGILASAQTLAWLGGKAMALFTWLYGHGADVLEKSWRSRWWFKLGITLIHMLFAMAIAMFLYVVLMTINLERGPPDAPHAARDRTPTLEIILGAPFDGLATGDFGGAPKWLSAPLNLGVQSAMLVTLAIVIATSALFALWILSSAMLALSLFAFGTSLWYVGPFAEMVVEPVPRGKWELRRLDWADVGERHTPLNLTHSEPYGTPQAQAAICEWLKELSSANR